MISIAASRGMNSARCSSVPNSSTIHVTMLWMDRKAEVTGQPRAMRLNTTTPSDRVRPVPPWSSEQ